MTAALVLILVSIIDVPSVVSIIGALKIRSWWTLPFIVFLAVVSKEVFGALFATFYEPFRLLPFTLIAQSIVAVLVFCGAQSIRKRYADDPKKLRKAKIHYIAVLIIIFFSLFAGMVYRGIQRGNAQLETAAEHTDSAKVTTPSHNTDAVPKDAFSKLFLHPEASNVSKPGERQEDGSIYLYREPVEAWWNDWVGKELSRGKVHISGAGKTAMFEGIIQLNCQNASGYTWLAAANYNNRAMAEEELTGVLNWGHAEDARSIEATLQQLCERVFREGEYA